MKNRNYFDQQSTGGANASRGFEYQDLCALFFVFKYIDCDGFKCVGIESNDDFSLHICDDRIDVQVKSSKLSIATLKSHALGRSADDKRRIFVHPSAEENAETFLRYLDQFLRHNASNVTDSEKTDVHNDFKAVLAKYDLSEIENKVSCLGIKIVPQENLEEFIALECVAWGSKNNLRVDHKNCFNHLARDVAQARVKRDFLSCEKIRSTLLLHASKIESTSFDQTLSNAHSALAADQDALPGLSDAEIAAGIRKKISLINEEIREGKFYSALETCIHLSHTIDSDWIYAKCACLFEVTDKPGDAEAYCKKALRLNPRSSIALFVLGTLNGERGDLESALDYLSAAEQADGSNAPLLYNIGVIYQKMGKAQEAAEYFQRSIAINPNDSSAHHNLGVALFDLGCFASALAHTEDALILEPGMPNALLQKAEVMRFFGKLDVATRLFERCLGLMPTNQMIQQGMATILLEQGDPRGAEQLIGVFSDKINRLEIGEALPILDIGWERVLAIILKRLEGDAISVRCGEQEIIVYLSNGSDTIGIGIVVEKNSRIPCIIKHYANPEGFCRTIEKLNELTAGSQPLVISGFVSRQNDHSEISLQFEGFAIQGVTNNTGNGAGQAFADAYRRVREFHLIIGLEGTSMQGTYRLAGIKLSQ